jgi:subtilisin family serine protease
MTSAQAWWSLTVVRRGYALLVLLAIGLLTGPTVQASPGTVTVRYTTPLALRGLRVRVQIPRLGIAEVTTSDITALRARPGVAWVRPTARRIELGSVTASAGALATGEWQYEATQANLVPLAVLRAAARITVAVVDTGADVTAPDLAAKSPLTYNAISGDGVVTDTIGHGTFVSSLAAGSVLHGVFAGFGGDARLMIVQASGDTNDFTDANEAAAIVWAVDHGANIVNLSVGGPDTSAVEQDALAYAAGHGVLVVAAAGNASRFGNLPIYPAALLGPTGLAVGASTAGGARASFSTAAPYVSLLAPGVNVLGALSSTAPASAYPHADLGAPADGLYGYGTGTSYAAPQVAGAAALVWGVDPALTAAQVVRILERTASRHGARTPGAGHGVLDVAAAVAAAQGKPAPVGR